MGLIRRQRIALFFLAGTLLFGCAGYGRLGPQVPAEKEGFEDLLARWDEFEVSVVYDDQGGAVALLFDPDADDRTLTGRAGSRLDNPAEALSVKREVEQSRMRMNRARLVTVLGPDGANYGYAFTALSHLILKMVDGKILHASAPSLSKAQPGA